VLWILSVHEASKRPQKLQTRIAISMQQHPTENFSWPSSAHQGNNTSSEASAQRELASCRYAPCVVKALPEPHIYLCRKSEVYP
jgi:hypothetical protein